MINVIWEVEWGGVRCGGGYPFFTINLEFSGYFGGGCLKLEGTTKSIRILKGWVRVLGDHMSESNDDVRSLYPPLLLQLR